MKTALLLIILAQAKTAAPPRKIPEKTVTAAVPGGDKATPSAEKTTAKPVKTKVYTFGALDVEGKLKTPQLLYFLNRIKQELDTSTPDKRSFMKELERTADDPNL